MAEGERRLYIEDKYREATWGLKQYLLGIRKRACLQNDKSE